MVFTRPVSASAGGVSPAWQALPLDTAFYVNFAVGARPIECGAFWLGLTFDCFVFVFLFCQVVQRFRLLTATVTGP